MRHGFLPFIIFVSLVCSIAARIGAEALLVHRVAVIGSFAGLQLTHNAGVAFGILLPPVFQEILIGLVFLLFCFLAVKHRHSLLMSSGFALIIGGAAGNLIDRIDDGMVTDFFQVGSFPVFNLADSFITIGAAILFLAEFLIMKRKS